MDKNEISNLALGHLGHGKTVTNIETESSAEARACNLYYTIALKKALRDFNYPFSTKFAALALIEEDEEEDDLDQWEYLYTYPSDCLLLRRIINPCARVETEEDAIPYRIAYGEASSVILTDVEDAIAEYTVYVTDANRYPFDFVIAFSYLLAHFIAPRITAGDPQGLGNKVFQLYQFEIEKAKAGARNEERKEPEPDAELIRARG